MTIGLLLKNEQKVEKFSNKLLTKSILKAFKEYKSNLDYSIKDDKERTRTLNTILNDDWLQNYIETEQYWYKHSRKKQTDPLSENDTFANKLEQLADYILDVSEDFEYPWLSKYKKNMNSSREIYINDDNIDSSIDIHSDMVDLFAQEESQIQIKRLRLSEKQKRELRNISENELFKYPELAEIYQNIINIKLEIGLYEDLTDDEKVAKQELYINKTNDHLYYEQQRAFNRWEIREPRVDLTRLLANKIHKENEINLNKSHKLILDRKELELKFEDVLNFYGKPSSGSGHLYKLKKLINELNYEMFVVKEQLLKPVGNRGYKPKFHIGNNGNANLEKIDRYFDFSNKFHIYALLSFQKEYTKFKDKDNKVKSITSYYPVYSLLYEKHKDYSGSSVYLLLKYFDELIDKAELTEVERDMIDIMLQKKDINFSFKHNHPYKRISEYINEKYKLKKDVKAVKYAFNNTISKKIANAYLNDIEQHLYITCTHCKNDKAANIRNFGRDQRKKNGFKSICRACERNKYKNV